MSISPRRRNDKAEYLRRRAAATEANVVIFSDDPDATEKLVDKIERLKKRQGMMKRANQLIRKADREGLADLRFSDETITKLFSRDYAGRVGFPNYALTNNSVNIRRLEKRLAAIQNIHDDETSLRFPRKRSAENSSATGFTGPRLSEPGNGTGATAQCTSPN
jgi:hypothetical protein